MPHIGRIIPGLFFCGLLFLSSFPTQASALGLAQNAKTSNSQITLRVDPSSVVIKVGDNGTVNLTVANPGAPIAQLCFGQQGFPDSGFVLTFAPECAVLPEGTINGALTVEATPAAAPQNFTAYVLAIAGNQTAQAPLTVTVVPGLPPWVPWLIIVVFFLFLAIAVMVNPKKILEKIRRTSKRN